MEVLQEVPVKFSENAIIELKRLYQTLDVKDDQYLRIGVKGGGCSGMSYLLAFDRKQENDKVYDIDGIPVVMDKAHGMYVLGMEIDYENGLNNRGFSFNNPNAIKTCGCGTSFSA